MRRVWRMHLYVLMAARTWGWCRREKWRRVGEGAVNKRPSALNTITRRKSLKVASPPPVLSITGEVPGPSPVGLSPGRYLSAPWPQLGISAVPPAPHRPMELPNNAAERCAARAFSHSPVRAPGLARSDVPRPSVRASDDIFDPGKTRQPTRPGGPEMSHQPEAQNWPSDDTRWNLPKRRQQQQQQQTEGGRASFPALPPSRV